MALLLGVDTGGTYTDAAVLDDAAPPAEAVRAKAKALTTRPDLAEGVGEAIRAALARGGVAPGEIALAALSTTLATNALVEGQGEPVGLVAIGFPEAALGRAGLAEALGEDPTIRVAGGHTATGAEAAPFDADGWRAGSTRRWRPPRRRVARCAASPSPACSRCATRRTRSRRGRSCARAPACP